MKIYSIINKNTILSQVISMEWCNSLEEYCKYLKINMINSNTVVTNGSSFSTILYPAIADYLRDIKEHEPIVIKTSVSGKRTKWHEIRYELLDEILMVCRNIYPNKPIILCDGPAYSKSFYDECKRLGWNSLIEKYCVTILDLNYDNVTMIDGIWPVSTTWLKSRKKLNVCKAKTHKRFGVTLSTKNLIGTLSGSCLGFPKLSYLHEHIPKFLYTLLELSPTTLNIIDGVRGVEGNGPMHGRRAKSDFMVLGTDAYMCDAYAIIEMGFHPAVVPALIIPLSKQKSINCDLEIDEFRKSRYDFLPSLNCSWMYKSLNKNLSVLEEIYLNLLTGVRECWINYLKNL